METKLKIKPLSSPVSVKVLFSRKRVVSSSRAVLASTTKFKLYIYDSWQNSVARSYTCDKGFILMPVKNLKCVVMLLDLYANQQRCRLRRSEGRSFKVSTTYKRNLTDLFVNLFRTDSGPNCWRICAPLVWFIRLSLERLTIDRLSRISAPAILLTRLVDWY